MKAFTCTVTDPVGIHARPAGLLVKEIRACSGHSVTITRGSDTVNGTKLIALMGLGIRQGDTVTVTIEGPEEAAVAQRLEEFFKSNL